jgi:hypothetical protein
MIRSVVAVLLLAGCTSLPPAGTPHDATAIVRPASMVIDREVAAPGDIVEVSFPDGMARGIMFVLEEETGASWTYRYILLAPLGDGEPSWATADGDVAVPDIGATGVGPDRLLIPEVAAPGSYRICTGNAAENVCARIEIVAGT